MRNLRREFLHSLCCTLCFDEFNMATTIDRAAKVWKPAFEFRTRTFEFFRWEARPGPSSELWKSPLSVQVIAWANFFHRWFWLRVQRLRAEGLELNLWRSGYRSALGHINKSAKCKAAGARLLVIVILTFGTSDAMVGGAGSAQPPRIGAPKAHGGKWFYYTVITPLLHDRF